MRPTKKTIIASVWAGVCVALATVGIIQINQSPSSPMARATTATTPHVLVIMEENKGYQATLGTCSADPYLCSLAATYASGTAWTGVGHPSAPNYLAFDSGSTQGLTSDCTPPSCGPFTAVDLGGQMTGAGIPWRAYMESMPSACYTGSTAGNYAEKHNPFMYFTDVRSSSTCIEKDVPYPGSSGLLADLGAANAPDFVWITPNLQDDMHNGTVQQGDAWLRANLAPVLTSPWYTSQNATVIVTMDEHSGDNTGSGGRVPMVVISNNAQGHGNFSTTGNHYSSLRAIEEAFGLPLLGKAASASDPLPALFGGTSPSPSPSPSISPSPSPSPSISPSPSPSPGGIALDNTPSADLVGGNLVVGTWTGTWYPRSAGVKGTPCVAAVGAYPSGWRNGICTGTFARRP